MRFEDELRNIIFTKEAQRKAREIAAAKAEAEAEARAYSERVQKIQQIKEGSRKISKQFIEPYLVIVNNVLANGKGVFTISFDTESEIGNTEEMTINAITSLDWDRRTEGGSEYGKRLSFSIDLTNQKLLWRSFEPRTKRDPPFSGHETKIFDINDPKYDAKMKDFLKEFVVKPSCYMWSIHPRESANINDR